MRVIDFYDDFECMGGECPYTCCSGWAIAVDEETYGIYRKEKGMLGCKLKNFTYQNKKGIRLIRKIHRTCPFHTKEKLCYFQKNGRMELMPKVCRLYPRRTVAYEKEVEVTMELSCIRCAELLVANPKRFSFVEKEGELPVNWQIDYIDQEFYQWMLGERKKLLDYLWDQWEMVSIPVKVNDIYEYIYLANQWLARDNREKLQCLSIPVGGRADEDDLIKYINSDRRGYAFFPISFLNKMIYGEILQERAGKWNSVLDRLLHLYDNYFGKIKERNADAFYQENIEKMMDVYPGRKKLFMAYFSYLLQQNFCMACEDYYLIKPVLLAILQLEFVMLFYLLEFMDGNEIDESGQAAIIAAAEKALRHSNSLSNYIMTLIRKRIFS